jgi:hypothetical protein
MRAGGMQMRRPMSGSCPVSDPGQSARGWLVERKIGPLAYQQSDRTDAISLPFGGRDLDETI